MDQRMFPSGVAFVAGGTGGLGSATCRYLAKCGSPVAIGYNRREKIAQELVEAITSDGGRAIALQANLADKCAINESLTAAEEFGGGINSVIYAAGAECEFDFFSKTPMHAWRSVFDGDLLNCIQLAKEAIPRLRRSSGAFVATTTYQAARTELCGGLSSVPKSAIEQLVKVIAKEEGRYGVRAIAVRAGWFDAGMGIDPLSDPNVRQRQVRLIPLGRIGVPEEFARVVAFMASTHASYVSGSIVTVDGGESV
jgi:NAD(P)-dependent dehydrogenase (short-subunit alcohol dehydrogenase family)